MLNTKIPLYISIILAVLSAGGTYFITKEYIDKSTANIPAIQDTQLYNCGIKVTRLNGYEYIKPILFAENPCPSPRLDNVRADIETLINSYKTPGTIANASVYLKHANTADWMSINEDEKYLPGSLMKVPELITFMKMNEKNPGLLNKKILYDRELAPQKNAVYLSKAIEVGKTYTIKELLYYMIAYSDNNATMVLNSMMDLTIFKKTFIDLGIPAPDLSKKDIPLTAKEFSFFMRAIYNACYLNIDDSEFCAELLSHSDFENGLVKGLPKNSKVAHKFGEAGDGNYAHFSESGIIYTAGSTYIVTIMTKGKDLKKLPAVVSEISSHIYKQVTSL